MGRVRFGVVSVAAILLGCFGQAGSFSNHRNYLDERDSRSGLELRASVIERAVKIHQSGGSGSGTLIYTNIALTANHVVDSSAEITVYNHRMESMGKWVVIARDVPNDLALIQRLTSYGLLEPKGPVMFSGMGDGVGLGMGICLSGFPWGVGPSFSTGFVSRVDVPGEFLVTATALPGNSGSGVFSHSGRLLGVLVRGWQINGQWCQFMFICVATDKVQAFLNNTLIRSQ